MKKLYLIVVKKSLEEVTSRESKPALEERREHHNLIHIGCENIFFGGGAPLQHGSIGEDRIHNKFANFFFIRDKCLKEMRMRSCHWRSEGVRRHGMRTKAQAEIAKNFGGENGGGERNVRVGAARSIFNEGDDSNPLRFGAKCVRFRLMVSFRSNGKNIQQYKINFHLFIIKETINKKI
jgi:hypothetical protein